MPRRVKRNEDDISLFPFLSIIACLIGVLTMMIATLALAETDNPDVALIENYQHASNQLDEAEEQIEKLRREIEVSNSTGLQLREEKKLLEITLDELKSILQQQQQVEQEIAELKEIEIVIPELDPAMQENAADRRAELESIEQQLATLEAELQARQDVPTEATVTVLPQGTGLRFTPQFVECADGAVVLHHVLPPKTIRTAAITTDADFRDLLQRTANSVNGTIVLLVRSDGLGTYRTVRDLCQKAEVRSGKIPVVGQGRIDLNAFIQNNNGGETPPGVQP